LLHFKKKFEDFWWIFQKLSRFFVFGILRNAVWSQIGGCSYLGNRTHLRAEIFRVSFFEWYNYVCKISRKSEDPHGDSFVGFCRILGACSLKCFTLESCYIWLTISLEYPSAYVHSCYPRKIQIRVHQGGT